MNVIQDCNNDGRIDWKDFLFYGMTITGNVVLTLINVFH